MELSVIITTRNREDDLRRCVSSLEHAVLPSSTEVIVIDDASTDGTAALTAWELSKVLTLTIHHQRTPLMMVGARNVGAHLAQGTFLLFIDDDNIIAPDMVELLVQFAHAHPEYGIIGPQMCLKDGRPYLDYQRVHFFTGRTAGVVDQSLRTFCETDGIPNVFMIRRELFEQVGGFDPALVQTFTEPDFAFHARRFHTRAAILKKARTMHNVLDTDTYSPRKLGGKFTQKAYCLMRNRTVIIARYGRLHHKLIYGICFSWAWPLMYCMLMLPYKRFDLMRLYWRGYVDGMRYLVTGELRNSLTTT